MIVTTDDGSDGIGGFTTDVLEVLLSKDVNKISDFLKTQKIALNNLFANAKSLTKNGGFRNFVAQALKEQFFDIKISLFLVGNFTYYHDNVIKVNTLAKSLSFFRFYRICLICQDCVFDAYI